MRWLAGLTVGLMLAAGHAAAGDLAPAEAAARLPPATQKRIARDPDRFVEIMALLIAGNGGSAGLDRDGIERHIAVERADLRAYHLRRLLAADLDNDGQVAEAELQGRAATVSAFERGLLIRAWRLADADHDRLVDPAEARAQAQAMALTGLTEAEAAVLRSLVLCDLDGDGAVSVDELAQVAAAAARGAGTAGARRDDI